MDRVGTIVAWNEAATQLLGYRREILGRKCWQVLRGCDVYGNAYCGEHCALREQAFRGEPVHACTMYYTSAGGEQVHVRARALLLGPDRLAILLSPAGALEPVEMGAAARPPVDKNRSVLSARQREVLSLMAEGKSTAEISDLLGISAATVRNHVQGILARLKVHNRLQAVVLARRIGLI